MISWRWMALTLLLSTGFSVGWVKAQGMLTQVQAAEQRKLAPAATATVIQPLTQVLITGAVLKPGIYQIPKGSRIYDLVQLAGGLTPLALMENAELAKLVPEGGEVKIKAQTVAPSAKPENKPEPKKRKAKKSKKPSKAEPVSLNTATLEQLDALPGVGPRTAERILEYRQRKGAFKSIRDLLEVPGIGEKKLKQLQGYLK